MSAMRGGGRHGVGEDCRFPHNGSTNGDDREQDKESGRSWTGACSGDLCVDSRNPVEGRGCRRCRGWRAGLRALYGVCHSPKAGENKIGPSLAGVFGRKSGSAPGYNYSPALKSAGITWDEQEVISVPNAEDRQNVIAYLKTLK